MNYEFEIVDVDDAMRACGFHSYVELAQFLGVDERDMLTDDPLAKFGFAGADIIYALEAQADCTPSE